MGLSKAVSVNGDLVVDDQIISTHGADKLNRYSAFECPSLDILEIFLIAANDNS